MAINFPTGPAVNDLYTYLGITYKWDGTFWSPQLGTIPIANGGTGQTTAVEGFDALAPTTTRGDMIYREISDNLRLAKGASGTFLQMGANDPAWATTLGIANGGTGQVTALAAFNALSPVTTRGDIIYRDATNNARLAKGTTGHFLQAGANDPQWSSPNHGFFSVHRNGTAQTAGFSGAGVYKIQFIQEDYDQNFYFDPTTNYRFQPTVSGKYFIFLSVNAAYGSVADSSQPQIKKNTTTVIHGFYTTLTNTGFTTQVGGVIDLNGSTDYVEGHAYVPSTITSIGGAPSQTFMQGWKIGE